MKKDKKSNLHTILLHISIPILVLVLMLLLFRCGRTSPGEGSEGNLTGLNDSGEYVLPELAGDARDWDGELARSGTESAALIESIAIPGYSNIVVSSSEPYLSLINPQGNSVYMVYAIYDGDTLLFETGAIGPDKELDINLYELLCSQEVSAGETGDSAGEVYSKEEWNIVLRIATYDCETYEPCNGATQKVHVTLL